MQIQPENYLIDVFNEIPILLFTPHEGLFCFFTLGNVPNNGEGDRRPIHLDDMHRHLNRQNFPCLRYMPPFKDKTALSLDFRYQGCKIFIQKRIKEIRDHHSQEFLPQITHPQGRSIIGLQNPPGNPFRHHHCMQINHIIGRLKEQIVLLLLPPDGLLRGLYHRYIRAPLDKPAYPAPLASNRRGRYQI